MLTASFTLAYWCVLIAALLPLVCTGIAKWGMFTTPPQHGGFDNNNPRAWLTQQTDWRARANAAQANSFEALPFFIGAVVIAHQLGAQQGLVNALAALFVLLRLVYVGLYLGNKAGLRSVVWMLAFGANIAILFAGYR
ncbi:MAPEG family protein [Rhodoferax antarcticus]|uniref:Putative membrane protein n=1 Tax=Rhodoferax antarcticus ANT.BR TaxID=1111071 RepID=A0A1Q8YEW7_9BURK|nr:MAPEG family protein [Rhodoferax antarcticus]APW46214.1 glutathione metabolism protein [Rhodoferax antarcticus]MCW2313509.1 putative MAPEG superfamily protein [Rhodoferax antarcticus]OLP06410.1 putative membrane protein [Rhodoferax antarcticus ANT.BR]